MRTSVWGFDGRKVIVDRRYDALGRAWETDQPRFDNAAAYLANRLGYDDLNRVVSVTTIDEGGVTRAAKSEYYGFKIVQTNAKGYTKTEWRNVLGQLYQVDDSNSPVGTTAFEYDPFGNLVKTTDPVKNVITVVYDLLGRKTDLKDPDLAAIHYDVDPLGQTWAQTSPKQSKAASKTYMVYDLLGRMTARYESDLESHWIFDTATMGVGKLAEANTQANSTKDYVRTQNYDTLGRPKLTTTQLSDATYTSQVDFDAYGRVSKTTYQRGTNTAKVFDMGYNGMGYLELIKRGSLVLWQVTAQDAAMHQTQLALGNGLKQTRSYYPQTGRLQDATLLNGTNVARLVEGYLYDQLGNVQQRTQHWDNGGFSETFEYDALNRLHTSKVDNLPYQVFEYDAIGNITSKTGVGTYTYPVPGTNVGPPHGVKSVSSMAGSFDYDDNGNLLNGAGMSMTWTSFDMPLSITKGTVSTSFVYGPEHQRVRQTRIDGSVVVYAGAQEVETKSGVVTVKTYWPNGIGVEIDRGTSATEMSWMHVDRLGSVIALTDQVGAIREKLEYDVWGKRRSTADNTSTPDSLDGQVDNRGFTGHEMLDQLDLVHMNGRVYNPLLGKFISPDPFIQDPMNGQGYNRYSYVLNNPVNIIDPTGYISTVPVSCNSVCREMADSWTRMSGDAARSFLDRLQQANAAASRSIMRLGNAAARMAPAARAAAIRVGPRVLALQALDETGGGIVLGAAGLAWGASEIGSAIWNAATADSGNDSSNAVSNSNSKNSASGGALPPDDENSKQERSYKKPNEKLEKGDQIDLNRFSKRVKAEGETRFEDPKSGYRISKDRAGGNSHGGSAWKLLDRAGDRIGTLSSDGTFLRK